jgi:heme exporter protein D
MTPDLGTYAGTVLSAYGVTLALLAALVALSWWRSERIKRALADTEAHMGGHRLGET